MKIKHSISILFMILLLASCKDGLTIFDQIDQETKLEDAVITGSVNSIVKSGNTLYASDGNIYAKSVNAVRGWSKIASPGGTIIKLAADATGVYALSKDKDTKLYFRQKDSSGWNAVTLTGIPTITTIFDDGLNHAFMKAGTSFFKLDGSNPPETGWNNLSYTIFTYNSRSKTMLYFSDGNTISMTTNTNLNNPPPLDKPTAESKSKTVSGLGIIHSLTYSEAENALYAGTSSGLKKIILDEKGDLTGETADPPGNWGATIKSYEAFAVLATGTTPNDFALYSSTIKGGTTYAKVNGLWGYYNSRNNWNRE